MATLVVEDGTGTVASANSYVSIAEVTTFCDNYGLVEWATSASSTLYTQAIIRATAFLDGEYDFKGEKYAYDDPLQWPRSGVYAFQDLHPEDEEFFQEVPDGVKKACCRAAYEELKAPGTLQSNLVSNVKREKIDVLETEYFERQIPSKTVYRTIEGFLKGLLNNSNVSNLLRC